MTTASSHTVNAIRLIIQNQPDLADLLNTHAAANPGDLHQAAADYCDQVLGPIFTEWQTLVHARDRGVSSQSAEAMLREVLPTGQDWRTTDMVAELMRDQVAE